MNLFNRRNKKEETRDFFPETRIVFGPLLFSGENNPTVSACVDKISNTLSILPIDLYAHTKNGKKLAVSHELFPILNKPNFDETPTLFYGTIIRHILLRGNAYIYIGRNKGKIVSLTIVDPYKITVQRDSNFNKIFLIDGNIYTEREILHIPYNGAGYNGTLGISPVDTHKELIQLDNDLLQYINVYFNNSLGNRYAIELGASYPNKPQDLDKLYAAITPVLNKYVTGVNNAGKPLIPPPDSKLTKIEQTSNVQAQLNSLLLMVERQIAEAFGVPYEVISGENKYGSLEQKQQDFLQNCIQPLGNHICESFEKLIYPMDSKLFISYDYSHMLKTSFKDTVDYLAKEVQSGLISTNEARSKLGMESIGPEGDYFWLPANLIPMTEENIQSILAKSKLALKEAEQLDVEKLDEHSPLGDDKA